jgi:stage III sporulation protein AB
MRYFLLMLLCALCVLEGWRSARKVLELMRREQAALQSLLILRREICFCALPLEQAARMCARKEGPDRELWLDYARALEGGADSAWAMEQALQQERWPESSAQILRALAQSLGSSSRSDQERLLTLAYDQLKEHCGGEEQQRKQQAKVRLSLGALSGAALLILLV